MSSPLGRRQLQCQLDTNYTGVVSAERGFEFIAGCACLNFVDTVADRAGSQRDLLTGPEVMSAWLRAAGLVTSIKVSDAEVESARLLREAIFRAVVAAGQQRSLPDRDVARINAAARSAPRRPQLHDGKRTYLADNAFSAALAELAADAVDLIGTGRISRVRRCPGCAMVFEDTSRPGSRRWCASNRSCGNKAKTRNLRARQKLETGRFH